MANFYYLDGYFYLEKIVKDVLMNVILYQIYFKVYIDQLFLSVSANILSFIFSYRPL